MALKRGDRKYNADTNEWEVKKPKKEAAKAKAAPAKAKSKAKAATAKKAPIPKDRPKKAKEPAKVRVPSQAVADQAAKGTKLKGKVSELPSKQKPHTKGGNTGDKSKKGANQIATYVKRRVR